MHRKNSLNYIGSENLAESNLLCQLHASSSYTLPARFLVPKQQFNPGTKTAPPDAGRALQPPRACAGCGRATTYTGQRQQLKWLLKDRPTHAALQFPNQTTAVGYPRTCGQQVARLPQTSTRRSWVSRAHATHSNSVRQVTTSAAVQPHVENRPRKPSVWHLNVRAVG
jgi:hypothetical protein